MIKIINMLQATKNCLEHPIYHPESVLSNHIKIVGLKALFLKNKELICAAILHDICKPIQGEYADIDGIKYWTNKNHDKGAFDLIHNDDDIRYWIKQTGANIDNVANICLHHMNCKQEIIKKDKDIPFIKEFTIIDDMVQRKQFPKQVGSFYLPNIGNFAGTITYVGQSPIQQHFKNKKFTVTLNRTPFVYSLNDVWKFFVGQYEEFQEIFKSLN